MTKKVMWKATTQNTHSDTHSTPSSRSNARSEALLRGVLPDMYFVNTPGARMERHREVLEKLGRATPQEQPLMLFHETMGMALNELSICAWDEIAPGFLAKICGTMAALNLSIHTAFIYTFRDEANVLGHFEAPATARPIALNTFLISENYFRHDRALSPKTQKRLQSELDRVLHGEVSVGQLLQKSRRRPFAPLDIFDITCENRPQDPFTRLSLRAQDHPGVLYRTTSALSQMGLNICIAQISTRDEAADDIFFLSDANGQRLPDFQLSTVAAQLRARLQDNAPDFDSA